MTRLDDSFTTLRQLGATYAGTMTLVRWAESERGRTATFRLDDGPDADAVHPFKGLPAHPKDGQRFKALLIMVADVAEEPEVPSDAPSEAGAATPANESAGVAATRERRKWKEMPYSTRAALICDDDVFWQWLNETATDVDIRLGAKEVFDSADAAVELRRRVAVTSRSELDRNPDAAERYSNLEERFFDYRGRGEHLRAAQ